MSNPHFVSLNRSTESRHRHTATGSERDRVRKSVWRGATLPRTKIAVDIMMIETSSSGEPKSPQVEVIFNSFSFRFPLLSSSQSQWKLCNPSARYVPYCWPSTRLWLVGKLARESLSHSLFIISSIVGVCRLPRVGRSSSSRPKAIKEKKSSVFFVQLLKWALYAACLLN